MSKADKLLAKLLSLPRDFTWPELVSVMRRHGFELYNGKGSGRKFIHTETGYPVSLHEPHPENVLKKYAMEAAIEGLRAIGAIQDE